MRVITGLYKGRKILSPKHEGVRPTTDRVKENIFNVISGYIPDSIVLDLFAGTGAIGIECLSRGAKEVCFVDSNKDSCKLISDNLRSLNIKAYVSMQDYNTALLQYYKKGKQFDIIYLDPPYNSIFAESAISKIYEYNLLAPDGIIIWESLSELNKPEKYSSSNPFSEIDKRKYGEIDIRIYAHNHS